MKKGKKIFLSVLRYLPLIVCAAFVIVYFVFGRDISMETIVNYAPENRLLAAAFILVLYAVKSLSIFFPVVIIYFAVGFLFPPVTAVLVNSLGVIIELAVPYLIGRISGDDYAGKILQKTPKLKEIIERQQGTPFFMSFFLRVISCLPADAVSMYFGAVKLPFAVFLAGSFLGLFPGLITSTLLGSSVSDPFSPMFWISVALTAGIAAASFIIYHIWKKNKHKNSG